MRLGFVLYMISTLVLGPLALANGKKSNLAQAKVSPASTNGSAPSIGKWLAVGSGCKGSNTAPNDMKLETEIVRAEGSVIGLKGSLKLPSYKLKSPLNPPARTITFARECAVRVEILPGKGMRVKTIAGEAKAEFSKEKQVSTKIQSLLYFNGEVAAASLNESPKGEAVGFREVEMKLVPGVFPQGSKMEKSTAPSNCGEPFMYGFDFTFVADRTAASDAVEMKLVGENQGLNFGLELEKCQ
jgi:hypothetical protein